jgi:uncharacterized protein YjbI with pentapeptide repeats
MAEGLDERTQARLIEKTPQLAETLIPFSADELAAVHQGFAERHRKAASAAVDTIPDFHGLVDFSNIEFSEWFQAEGFLFPAKSDFSRATFSAGASFQAAAFSESVDFSEAKFQGSSTGWGAEFQGAAFFMFASFHNAAFSKGANFQRAAFLEEAWFYHTTFAGPTIFRDATIQIGEWDGATFSDQVYFENATFIAETRFKDASFSETVSFSGAHFYTWLSFESATFVIVEFQGAALRNAYFKDATFFEVDFEGSTFAGNVDFDSTKICDGRFQSVIFSAETKFQHAAVNNGDFQDAAFLGDSDFREATFAEQIRFDRATFSSDVSFQNAIFSNKASFIGVTFASRAWFVNAEMKGPTSFEFAIFQSEPPQFSDAKLSEGTIWRRVSWPLPESPDQAGPFIDAYEKLKLEMDRLKKHHEELDFFALELQSRWVYHGAWRPVSELKLFGHTIPIPSLTTPAVTLTPKARILFRRTFALPPIKIPAWKIALYRPAPGLPIVLYEFLSDYGRSYARPLLGLAITAIGGAPLFWAHLGLSRLGQALGLSLANTLGVLGFRKDFIDTRLIDGLPGSLKIIAALQTIFGIVLLFLFGLAIRNRLRIK